MLSMQLPNPFLSPEREAYFRAVARRKVQEHAETLARARAHDGPTASDADVAALNERVREATADDYRWLRYHTQTNNPHWIEEGRPSPYESFPDKPYFPVIFEFLHAPGKVKAIEKSRDMMLTWAIMGFFTKMAMTIPEREIVCQTLEEEKCFQLIEYAKTLYIRQPQWLREQFPLTKSIEKMSKNELSFANGSVIWGVPGGLGKMRSYHPWGYFNDETAFQPEAGHCYNEALSACQKIVLNSTAWPGWFFDWLGDIQVEQ